MLSQEVQRLSGLAVVRMVWGHRFFILAGTLLVVVPVWLASLRSLPQYRASAKIMATGSKIPTAEGRIAGSADIPSRTLATLVATIANQSLAEAAVRRFSLDKSPYQISAEELARNRISVSEIRGTNLIQLSIAFPDPNLAAQITNFLAEQAVEQNIALNRVDTVNTRDFIKGQMDAAKVQLDQILAEIERSQNQYRLDALSNDLKILAAQKEQLEMLHFYIESNLRSSPSGSGGVNVLIQGNFPRADGMASPPHVQSGVLDFPERQILLSEQEWVAHKMSNIQTNLQAQKAEYEELASALAKLAKVETVYKSVGDDLILLQTTRDLKLPKEGDGQRLQLRSEELNPNYLDIQKRLIQAKVAIASQESQMEVLKARKARNEEAFNKVNDRLLGDLKGRLDSIRQRMDSLAATLKTETMRADALKANLALARNTHDLFAKRYGESNLSVAATVNDLKLVDRAVVPVASISRPLALNVLVAVITALIFFSFLSFLWEYLKGYRWEVQGE